MSDFWQNPEEEAFEDRPDQLSEQDLADAPRPIRTQNPQQNSSQNVSKTNIPFTPLPVEDAVTYSQVNSAEEEEEDFVVVLNDARLRLEQGKLYELIMNHDIFSGVDADERAIKHVQRQMRNFAKEQMEIMLGMRQEQSKNTTSYVSPFTDMEIQTLKDLAYVASKGATSSPESQNYTPQKPQPISAAVKPKQIGLNPIAPKSNPVKPIVPTQKNQPGPSIQKPIQAKPAPIQRQKVNANVQQILAEEGLTLEQIEEVMDSKNPLSKPGHELSEQELLDRAKRSKIQRTVKSSDAKPMMSPEQQEMFYANQAMQTASNPKMQGVLGAVLKHVANNRK